MPTSFPVGLKTAQKHAEPRFFLACGTQTRLRGKLLEALTDGTEYEVHDLSGDDPYAWYELFTAANRQSKEKLVVLHNAEKMETWQPLKQWLDRCKRIRLVAESDDTSLGTKLADVVKSRGTVVDCNKPTAKLYNSFTKFLTENYAVSSTEATLLLKKVDWDADAAIAFLEKLALMNASFDLGLLEFFGVPSLTTQNFEKALLGRHKAEAFFLARKVHYSNIPAIITNLSTELDLYSRLTATLVGMKTVSDIATEAQTTIPVVKEKLPMAKKYDWSGIARANLALAKVSSMYSKGYTQGILELLITFW